MVAQNALTDDLTHRGSPSWTRLAIDYPLDIRLSIIISGIEFFLVSSFVMWLITLFWRSFILVFGFQFFAGKFLSSILSR